MMRTVIGILWGVVFFLALSFLVGFSFGFVAGITKSLMIDRDTLAAIGGITCLVVAAILAVVGTKTEFLPGTRRTN